MRANVLGLPVKNKIASIKQEAQLMLTNLRDAFGGQSRSPNIVPFHMLGIVSYCATVTVSLRRAVFTIFDLKNVVTLKDSIALCMPTIVCEKGVYAEQLDERFAHDPKSINQSINQSTLFCKAP